MPRKRVINKQNKNETKKGQPKQLNALLLEAIQKNDLKAISTLLKDPKFFEESYKYQKGNTPFHYIDKIKDAKLRKEIATKLIAAGMRFAVTNDEGHQPTNLKEYVEINEARKKIFSNGLANFLLIHPKNTSHIVTSLLVCVAFSILLPQMIPFLSIQFLLRGFIGGMQYTKEQKDLQRHHHLQLEADFVDDVIQDKLNIVKLVKYIKQGVNIRKLQINKLVQSSEKVAFRLSALDLASMLGSIDQINLLAPHMKKEVMGAIYIAIIRNEIGSFNLLLSKLDKLNARNGARILDMACENKRSQMVKALLQKGIVPSSETYERAKKLSTTPIVRMLRSASNLRENMQKNVAPAKSATVVPLFTAKQKAAKTVAQKADVKKTPQKAADTLRKKIGIYKK